MPSFCVAALRWLACVNALAIIALFAWLSAQPWTDAASDGPAPVASRLTQSSREAAP